MSDADTKITKCIIVIVVILPGQNMRRNGKKNEFVTGFILLRMAKEQAPNVFCKNVIVAHLVTTVIDHNPPLN